MRRRLFNLSAGASLGVCVAAGGLWGWSYAMATAGPMVQSG